MRHYVYWYCSILLRNSIGDNEKINDYYYYKLDKQILLNIETLEEWSRCMYNCVVYDSDIDGKDTMVFKNKLLNHSHLYFIAIDTEGNIFGHYHHGKIVNISLENHDGSMFLFTLYINGRSEIKKFDSKYDTGYTTLGECFYACGFNKGIWDTRKVFTMSAFSSCYKCTNRENLLEQFEGVQGKIFDSYLNIKIKRIFVIEML